MRKILAFIYICIGLILLSWSLYELYSGDLHYTGKYSPEGRNATVVGLSGILGVSFVLYGVIALKLE